MIGDHVLPHGDGYLNVTTGEYLPATATEGQFRAGAFFLGQNLDAIQLRLRGPANECRLIVVPSWDCNLRCGHCSVIHQLTRNGPKLPVEWTRNFLDEYRQHYTPRQYHVHFIGGEPLLDPDLCLEIVESLAHIPIRFAITTNLSVRLDEAAVRLLDRMDRIVVSLDGSPSVHDAQRKDITGDSTSPFMRTVCRIKAICRTSLASRLHVQAAVKDQYQSVEFRDWFVRFVQSLGVPTQNISYGGLHPTDHNGKPSRVFTQHMRQPTFLPQACCKYRRMGNFVLTPHGIYADYFRCDEANYLGRPGETSMATMEGRHREIIQGMPCLHDGKCLGCPVIGLCWGKCTVGDYVGGRPSDRCNQAALIERARQLAEAGELRQHVEASRCEGAVADQS